MFLNPLNSYGAHSAYHCSALQSSPVTWKIISYKTIMIAKRILKRFILVKS